MAEEKKHGNTAQICRALALPVAEKYGLELWDVRFEKEGSEWYLRFFIDKDGLTIDDCENFSRAVEPILDEADPIEQHYCLEVSSPGIERKLLTEEHIRRYFGSLVDVRFVRPPEGYKEREFIGILTALEDGIVTLTLDDGTALRFPRSDAAFIKLHYDFDKDPDVSGI
mgnify:FL=1